MTKADDRAETSGHTPLRRSRTATRQQKMSRRLPDIGWLIDRVARARRARAVQAAVWRPSPANVAALQEWPCDWVSEELARQGVPRVGPPVSPIRATGSASRRESQDLAIPSWAA
jgi:hypothetical protein